ncbi:MAG: M23 family metallopeptidase [Synergistaceae bacterium]|jgi:murein DD-endopeptidase MepM/ murein hydrolase activator NlpD|nr:M23 family metallopeptidase [Synergistaceae bacterium]MCE5183655.1 M23 family metallopeptidase [Synergistaceae bacterium]MDD4838003.1 M23 family metallopeptidase [Synergistaceae bacterium]
MDRITEANDRLSNSTKQKYCAFINLFGLRIGGVYVLCFILLSILLTPDNLYAEEIDYQALQEDPLETAYRKLGSPGDIEWDEEEMVSGGAPLLISDMKWPLKSGELSSLFSRTRSKGRRKHLGIDIVAPKGTPVHAVLDGIVEVVSNGGKGFRGYGRVIIINHSDQLWTLYSHCSTMNVKVGQRVKRGDVIAAVGRTGRATTNHLHFEVRNAKGTALDPMKYLPEYGALPNKPYRR